MGTVLFDSPTDSFCLICIFIYEAMPYGSKQYLEIKSHGPVFDIVNVVVDSFPNRSITAVAIDLGPSGKTGANLVLDHVAWDLFLELLNELRALRPWSHEAHLADEDVEELWHLIDAGLTKESADLCDPGIVLGGPAFLFLSFCLDLHGPELVHHERNAVSANSLLLVDDGSRAGCLDSDGRRQHDR